MSYRDAGISGVRGARRRPYFCCLVFGKGDGERLFCGGGFPRYPHRGAPEG